MPRRPLNIFNRSPVRRLLPGQKWQSQIFITSEQPGIVDPARSLRSATLSVVVSQKQLNREGRAKGQQSAEISAIQQKHFRSEKPPFVRHYFLIQT
jgi:hypothetical protein